MTRATTVNIGRAILSTQYGLSEANDDAGDTPIVGMKDIQDGRVNLRPTARIQLTPDDRSRYRLQKGDILLNRTNSPALVGKAAIVEEDADVVFASYLVRLKTDLNVAIPEYLNYWINSDQGQMQIQALATRAISQANLNPTTFCQHFKLPLPDRDRQQNAVRVLQAWDQGISLTTELLATAEQRHTGLMQQLLTGRQRLKGFKADWQAQRLSALLTRVTRKNTAGCTRALTVSAQRGLVEQGSYFAKQMAAEDNEHYLLLQRGEFAYNRSAALGCPYGAIKRLDDFDEGIVSTLCLCFGITDPKAVHTDYLNAIFDAGLLNRQLRAIAHEGARSHGLLNVTSTDFFKMQLSLPSPPEQAAIAEVLNEAAEAARLQRLQLQALQQQKRALLQRLLSGEPT